MVYTKSKRCLLNCFHNLDYFGFVVLIKDFLRNFEDQFKGCSLWHKKFTIVAYSD